MTTVLAATTAGLRAVLGGNGAEPAGMTLVDGAVIAFDRQERPRFVLGGDGTVWRRPDGAEPTAPWEMLAAVEDLEATCLVAAGDEVLVGTEDAHLCRVAARQVEPVAGFEQAEGRGEWYTPWGGPPNVRSMAIGPDGDLWANVHVGGILRSTDAGATWRPTIDLHTDVHQVLATDGLVLAACGDGGLARSHDGGATWDFATDGLHGTYCRALALAGDHVLVSASTGPSTKQAAVYRQPLDGDDPLERVSGWLDFNVDTFTMAGAADGSAAVWGGPDGAVHRSVDGGATWSEVLAAGAPVRAVALLPAT